MKILVLDDDAKRHKTFRENLRGHPDVTYAWSYKDVVKAYEGATEKFHAVYLDHDLCDDHYRGKRGGVEDGTDVARFIAALDENLRPNLAIIHSMNLRGAERMQSILSDAGIYARWIIFTETSGTELDS